MVHTQWYLLFSATIFVKMVLCAPLSNMIVHLTLAHSKWCCVISMTITDDKKPLTKQKQVIHGLPISKMQTFYNQFFEKKRNNGRRFITQPITSHHLVGMQGRNCSFSFYVNKDNKHRHYDVGQTPQGLILVYY